VYREARTGPVPGGRTASRSRLTLLARTAQRSWPERCCARLHALSAQVTKPPTRAGQRR